jgi:deoxyribonuclease-4
MHGNRDKVKIIFSHCSYLLNLASLNEEIRIKSIDALVGEVTRCDTLGLSIVYCTPVLTKDQTPEAAIQKIIAALKEVLKETDFSKVKILLENTAGQGSAIGYRFEHLKKLLDGVQSERTGVCLDTLPCFSRRI